ncbi:hypothetical protein D3C73_463440 [compost metagenome]
MAPNELKKYFESILLPETLQLTPGVKILNVKNFISTQFATIENTSNNLDQCPAWSRF